jgi:flagellar basal body rod protein FlgF
MFSSGAEASHTHHHNSTEAIDITSTEGILELNDIKINIENSSSVVQNHTHDVMLSPNAEVKIEPVPGTKEHPMDLSDSNMDIDTDTMALNDATKILEVTSSASGSVPILNDSSVAVETQVKSEHNNQQASLHTAASSEQPVNIIKHETMVSESNPIEIDSDEPIQVDMENTIHEPENGTNSSSVPLVDKIGQSRLENHEISNNSTGSLKSEFQDQFSNTYEQDERNNGYNEYSEPDELRSDHGMSESSNTNFEAEIAKLEEESKKFSSTLPPAPQAHIPTKPPITSHQPSTFPVVNAPKKNRLVILYDKLRYYHLIMHLSEHRRNINENLIIIELPQIEKLIEDPYVSKVSYDFLNISIEYNADFEQNLKKLSDFLEKHPDVVKKIPDISYHVHFAPDKKWKTDYSSEEKQQYRRFLDVLNNTASENVHQSSIINKYDMDTVYLTEKEDLETLGEEIQQDVAYWKNLKIFDYGESSIRFLPGVKFPDTLEILNIGGGYALETLTGFKMPPKLKTLLAGQGALYTIDNVNFPVSLERLELSDNKIYFLTYVEFPPNLQHLDVSQNRIESLRGVNFPRSLISLNLGYNPIHSIKSVRFPEGLKYLDVGNIPNESMTGVKFPDLLINLNLQASMTNTRGLKLPPGLLHLSLCDNGVNSINPLKLPNSITVLYLNNNNIKTLNKVQFPPNLRELYLGNNMITTFKNVQFPPTLEVLDMEMDPEYDEQEKHITTLKDVIFPPNLKVLKLGYHSIKLVEAIEFPYSLVTLSLPYNEIKVIRNVRFGNNLKTLDLSGNKELTNIDHLAIPESVSELRIHPELVENLPAYIIERANKKQLLLKQSLPF